MSFGKYCSIDKDHSDSHDNNDGKEVADAADLFMKDSSDFSHFQ